MSNVADSFFLSPTSQVIATDGPFVEMDEGEVGSPLWWVNKLSHELGERAREIAALRRWYDGDHPIPRPPTNSYAHYDAEARAAFTELARQGVSNFMAPVVDQPASKLIVEGFRFGSTSTDTNGDEAAWTIWQRNCLDADHHLTTTESLAVGTSFAMVWADDLDESKALVTVEDPECCIVAYEAGSRRRRAAGLKMWVDEFTGLLFATLYTPGAIYKFRSTKPRDEKDTRPPTWVMREVPGEPWPLLNPLGVVPLVELPANRSLRSSPYGGGKSEFAKVIPDQKRVNRTLMSMLQTQEHQAWRQRWVSGWEMPVDENGNVLQDSAKLQVLKAAQSSLMVFPDPNTKVGDFSQADFRPFIDSVNMNARLIASATGTPPRAFLLGDLINVAADALTAIEGTFVAKVRRHQLQFGEAWEEVMRLALKIEGRDDLAADTSAHVVWAEVEERSATESANLAQIEKNLGVPIENVFATLPGVSQQQAKRWANEFRTRVPAPPAA